MVDAAGVFALAERIDADRARILLGDFGSTPKCALAVLLGTAFPPLTPRSDHQLDALEGLADEGLRPERRRRDLFHAAFSRAAEAETSDELLATLRQFVWAERARIAIRELLPTALGGAPIETTARELSALADTALEVALFEAQRFMSARFGAPLRADREPSRIVALGMGKLGGLELNAGSDVDLMFVYDTDDGESRISLHDHWTRVVQRAVATIDTPTASGLIWRVDLRLRPEGSRGPVVNSVAATDRYYETWGRLWERAALIRARPCAGDPELGELVLREIVAPFVYRYTPDPEIFVALSDLVERSRAELSRDPRRDLKLGPGGIREAEFFVQALQLFWGGQEPTLRAASTLTALARLQSRGLVTHREARQLGESYLLLRKLEHRVQWMSGVQTHLLPSEAGELARLARTLGYADERPLSLDAERARESIAELFASLLPQARPRRREQRFQLLLGSLSDVDGVTTESERLFGNADLGEHLSALGRRPDGPLGERTLERYPELGETLLGMLEACADPEQAARSLRSFFGRFASFDSYVTALAEDPRALSRFITVLGASEFVAHTIVARPELADIVLFGGGSVSDPRAAVTLALTTQLSDLAPHADDYDRQQAAVTALRLTKRRVMVEVAVADLAGSIGTREATRILSDLADAIVQHATIQAMDGDSRGLAVIALGKLGGREIGYGSDLDIVFVFEPSAAPPGDDPVTYFARRAQRLLRLLSEPSAAGPGYELDTRLRPSGSQGMLVTSLAAFSRYHAVTPAGRGVETSSSAMSSGAAWERQALLRARVCAGDAELGREVLTIAHAAAYERGPAPVNETHQLRMRMERELGRERPDRRDLKSGFGGLLDIEFAVQWLQMRHGRDPNVRTTDTLDALDGLHAGHHLDRARYETFREGYRFLRRLEQRIHVLTGTSSSVIDMNARGLEQLARRMGFRDEGSRSSAKQLIDHYHDVTRSVREAYLVALGLG